ncbi:MAG: hypothetical protein ACREJ2_11675 [Planctomycetota bacterium]
MANGVRIRGINQDTDRVSVQSTEQDTHLLTRRRWRFLPAKWTDVSIGRDELIVLKCNDGTAVIELKHLGGPHGDLVVDERGERRHRVRDGQVLRITLERNKAVFLKTQAMRYPFGSPGRAMLV